jgi:uncharacterized membrane protein
MVASEPEGNAMSTENYEIMMAVFPTEDGAQGAGDALDEMAKTDAIQIVDAAILVRDADGKTSVEQHSLPSVGKGAKWGAIIGGVVGLIFPPSIIGAAALGAGIGAGSAALADWALKSDDLKEAAEQLEPGTSAFVAVVENTWVEKVNTAMAGYSKLSEHVLDADAAMRLGVVADDNGNVAEYGMATAVDSDTGERVVAGTMTAADAATGDVVSVGAAVDADPTTGEVTAGEYVATGNLADTDDDADASASDESDTGTPDAT